MIDEKKFMKALEDAGVEHVSFDDLRKFVDKFPKVDEFPKNKIWFSCSEHLPEDGQRVLAIHKRGLNQKLQVIEHLFKDGRFWGNWDMDTDFKSPTFGQCYMGDVILWQPLPEAYHG